MKDTDGYVLKLYCDELMEVILMRLSRREGREECSRGRSLYSGSAGVSRDYFENEKVRCGQVLPPQ